jgi:hypothetical protein
MYSSNYFEDVTTSVCHILEIWSISCFCLVFNEIVNQYIGFGIIPDSFFRFGSRHSQGEQKSAKNGNQSNDNSLSMSPLQLMSSCIHYQMNTLDRV